MIAGGFVLLVYGCAKADWQAHMQVGDVWIPATTLKGYTAKIYEDRFKCEWSLVELSSGVVSGTRLQCRQTRRPAPRP